MANLKDTKRRIVSVKNTQKITHAMKLVSAAKFARANNAVINSRPYSKAFKSMVGRLITGASEEIKSSFVGERPEKKLCVILVGTDRGLCGSLNNGLFKTVHNWAQERQRAGASVNYWALGKRSVIFARKYAKEFRQHEKALDRPDYDKAYSYAEEIVGAFESGEFDHIYLAFNEFQSALVQRQVICPLLPVPLEKSASEQVGRANYIVEPNFQEVTDGVLRRGIVNMVLRSLLEGAACEHGARMTAMDSATKNAKEMIGRLTLVYNRGRQAAITKELIEIVSGAEAL